MTNSHEFLLLAHLMWPHPSYYLPTSWCKVVNHLSFLTRPAVSPYESDPVLHAEDTKTWTRDSLGPLG